MNTSDGTPKTNEPEQPLPTPPGDQAVDPADPSYSFRSTDVSALFEGSPGRMLRLPGIKGFPVRGELPTDVTDPRVLEQTLQKVCDCYVQTFDLTNPVDTQLYGRIMSAAATYSWVKVVRKEWQVDETQKVAVVEWYETFYQQPTIGRFDGALNKATK
jgi:hypothetical protein